MDTKSSKCVHLVEGGTNGSQDVNMAPMGKTSLGRVIHARKRQKHHLRTWKLMVMDLVIWPATLVPVVFPTRLFRRELFPLGIFQSGTTLGFKRVPRVRVRPNPGHGVVTPWGGYGGQPGQRVEEQGTWASRTQKHSEAGYGRPVARGAWTAKTAKRPLQQPAQPPIRQLLGAGDAQTAHHATFSTAPTHQLLGSANTEMTPARAPAAAADRKQRPDATCERKNG